MHTGDPVPNVLFHATGDINASLADYRGQWVVLYFYPKDATPGCSIEGRNFRDASKEFSALNAIIFGVSRDTLKSHENFRCKEELPFDLISDTEEELCQLFDVMAIKSMYGKKLRGIERSTFLITPQGFLQQEWRKVKVTGHVEEVLAAIKASSLTAE